MANSRTVELLKSMKFGNDKTHQEVLLENEDSDLPIHERFPKNLHHGKRRTTFIKVFLAITVASVLGMVLFEMRNKNKAVVKVKGRWMDCGKTAAEARARNCHYEQMHRSWIPDACYFPEPSAEYRPFRDRQWFKDEYLSIPATPEMLDRLESGDEEMAYAE